MRIQLIDVFAQDGRVRVQPVVVNDLATTTLFLPDNLGALGHFDVRLYDGNNNRVPYTFENAPSDDGHRIYSKGDILPVVPKDAKRLEPTTLIVDDSIGEGRTLYARMDYTFSTTDTLRATSATTFPDLNLDSLQVPVFDTLRTDGQVRVPDSLVLQRDTTKMRVTGIDTTVTRNGYLLFSTLRESNAAPTPKAARNLLYVPDSVKARAERDSLKAIAEADTTVPPIDTSAISSSETQFKIVDRTDRSRLDSLLTHEQLAASLMRGLPSLEMSADSLLSMSSTLRDAFLQSPVLTRSEQRRGFDTEPDSVFGDAALLSAPRSDSLFRLFEPDTAAMSDTSDDILQNVFAAAGPPDRLSPQTDSITIDSLRLTVSPDADSVIEKSVITDDLQNPPSHSYWYVPDSLSRWRTQVMVVDPSFFKLGARARIDTTSSINVDALLPKRVGSQKQLATRNYPQQVIRSPEGTYRRSYLKVWRKLQADNLKDHYCQIFPFPLRSEWRSTSMH